MTIDLWVIFLIVLGTAAVARTCFYVVHARTLGAAQELLKRAKQEVQEIAQLPLSNPHPLIQISRTGEIIFANPAAFEKFPDIKEKGARHPVIIGLQDAIAKNETAAREVTLNNATYRQTVTPTRVGDKRAFIIYCYDITDRKHYEEELKNANQLADSMRQEAERANQARGDFLANMSHELRTPMNGIIGLSDILVESDIRGQQREMIEAINASARNLLIVLNDILDFSKIEAGELTIESIPFDIRRIAAQIEKLQKPMAEQKGLALRTVIDNDVPQRLMGDPARLQQIFNNLIGNALKFTSKGSVTLSIGGKKDSSGRFIVRAAVTDTGIGIPRDKHEKIFTKFQQAESSTARKYGGTGLGLTITRELAELMGGYITLHSDEGKGSTFTVILAMHIAQEEERPGDQARTGKDAGAGINTQARIMVVDDHPVNLLFMRQVLGKTGFGMFDEASSGREAVTLFGQNAYDLIFMDCQMPEMDGFECARKIRDMERAGDEPVIIAVTADAMKGAAEKCKAAGMDDYISKPVDKEKLNTLLRKWIPGHAGPAAGQDNDRDDKRSGAAAPLKVSAVAPLPLATQEKKPAILDRARLLDFTDGDRNAERKVIEIFINNLKQDVITLERSYRAKDYKKWDEVAHKLYGASSHMGADALAGVCDQAQSLSHNERERMKDIHPAIIQEYYRVHKVLREISK